MKVEFHKNAAKLLMQGVIDQELVRTCIEVINQHGQDLLPGDPMDFGYENPVSMNRDAKEVRETPRGKTR